MAGGFKIADAFVEVGIQDQIASDVARIDKTVKGIDDKIVDIGADDHATPIIAQVDAETIDDKIVDIKVDTDSLKKLDDAVTKSRRRQEDAAGSLRIAELQLQKVRDDEGSTALQTAVAEERYAKALRSSKSAEDDSRDAAGKLAAERKKVAEESAAAKGDDSGGGINLLAGLKKSRGALLGEAKSAGMQAGALFGGSLAAGAAGLIAVGLFAGIGAAAQATNPVVASSFNTTFSGIKAEAQSSSSVLAGTFLDLSHNLANTAHSLQPELTQGFIASKPAVNDLFDGIDRGARAVMPGFVAAAGAASQATNGVADAMESGGRAVSNFSIESSKGAEASGDGFRTLGTIMERLGTFGGRIIADLANNATSMFPVIVHVVDQASTTVENLAHVALPGIASGAGLALTGISGLLSIANVFISVLGPIIPLASSVATSLKLIDMVSFGGVGRSWASFKTAIGEGEGVFGKVKAGAGSLLSTLGPVGLAAGLVTIGLGELSHAQQNAAAAEEAHTKRVDTLTDALRKSNGVINEGVRTSAAEALGKMAVNQAYQDDEKIKKSTLDASRDLNIDSRLLADAYLGQGNSLNQLNGQLDAIMSPYKDYNDMVARANPEEQKRWLLAEQLKDTINKQGGEFATAAQRAADLQKAAGQASDSTNILSGAFGTLSDKAASANDKISAVVQIMDRMSGRKPEVEDTTRAWEELLDKLNNKALGFTGFDHLEVGTKKWAKALVDTNGNINLTNDDGRKLFDTVKGAEKDFAGMAQSMKDNGATQDQVRSKLQGMRDDFIKNTQAMGFTKDQAIALADKYGLIPGNVSTVVFSNLAPELQKAISLGGKIETMPDGSFTVTSNTNEAQGKIDKLIQTNDGRVITLHVNTISGVTLTNSGGTFSRLKADGGPIVGPGTGTSDSIPLMASNGEYMIKAKAARKPGMRQVLDWINNEGKGQVQTFAGGGPVGAWQGAGGAPGASITNHWHLPPGIDIEALAAKVARRMTLQAQGRG